MFNIDEETLKNLRRKYPKGSKVRLTQMDDPYTTIPKETIGTELYMALINAN